MAITIRATETCLAKCEGVLTGHPCRCQHQNESHTNQLGQQRIRVAREVKEEPGGNQCRAQGSLLSARRLYGSFMSAAGSQLGGAPVSTTRLSGRRKGG